jgi:hypothetical protein
LFLIWNSVSRNIKNLLGMPMLILNFHVGECLVSNAVIHLLVLIQCIRAHVAGPFWCIECEEIFRWALCLLLLNHGWGYFHGAVIFMWHTTRHYWCNLECAGWKRSWS